MTTRQPHAARQTARVMGRNGAQTLSIPAGLRFPESVREVFIRREGESVILTPRPADWSGFFASGLKASADFMAKAARLPAQQRKP